MTLSAFTAKLILASGALIRCQVPDCEKRENNYEKSLLATAARDWGAAARVETGLLYSMVD